MPVSPKDRFITVYGRNPVLEVLLDDSLGVDKVVLADNARGPHVAEIVRAARARGLTPQRVSPERVKKLAGNGRQDQGVFADVEAPRMRTLADALADERVQTVLLLDGITTPANVGMILRTATAAGMDGIIVPRRGVASLDPHVVKASAGIAFRAPIVKCATAYEAATELRGADFTLVSLDAWAHADLYESYFSGRVALVLGSETAGLSDEVDALVDERVRIPMASGVESLNVAAAAAVLCFELTRRTLA